jgi:hypothetical protein
VLRVVGKKYCTILPREHKKISAHNIITLNFRDSGVIHSHIKIKYMLGVFESYSETVGYIFIFIPPWYLSIIYLDQKGNTRGSRTPTQTVGRVRLDERKRRDKIFLVIFR